MKDKKYYSYTNMIVALTIMKLELARLKEDFPNVSADTKQAINHLYSLAINLEDLLCNL